MKTARILTLEEVIRMSDELMWIEIKTAHSIWADDTSIICPTSPYKDNKLDGYSVSFQSGHIQMQKLYGRQWRCWTAKPSKKQREATEWN